MLNLSKTRSRPLVGKNASMSGSTISRKQKNVTDAVKCATRRKPLARKSKFHAQTNPFKTYKARHSPEEVILFAREARRKRLENQTEAERRFCELLGRVALAEGKDFEREKIIYRDGRTRFIIIDYYIRDELGRCFAVELDGKIHRLQKRYDKGRDLYLEEIGIKTIRIIRFSNCEVLKNPEEVKRMVVEALNE